MGDRGLIRHEATGRGDTTDPAVSQLIRRLIESTARSGPADEADEVILDIEVDGFRYLAVRCATRPVPDADRARAEDAGAAPTRSGHALSPRELEIARMVAKGYANKSIATVLDISSWTVSSHLRRIFSKLGVTSRAAMVAQLLDEGRSPEIQPEPERDVWRAELRRHHDDLAPAFAPGQEPDMRTARS
jgi:DNA-binding CsgD family transcriptional regulator